MIILRELLVAAGTVTVLELDLRDPAGKLIKQIHIGEEQTAEKYSIHQQEMIRRGTLELISAKINHHGDVKRNGFSETSFWPNLEGIPKHLLDAQVVSFYQRDLSEYRGREGSLIHADIRRIQQTLTDMI